jgi:hypothetical protein
MVGRLSCCMLWHVASFEACEDRLEGNIDALLPTLMRSSIST